MGFSDAESSFNIVPKQDSNGNINRFTLLINILGIVASRKPWGILLAKVS